MTWRNKFLTTEAKSIEDMISLLRATAEQLDQMRRDGVVLDANDGVGDDYAHLVTTDAKVAEKYGLIDESDYWGIEQDDAEPQPPLA